MKKLLYYVKKIVIFLGILFAFCLALSFFNMVGLSKKISTIMLFVINVMAFFICGYIHGKKTEKKGLVEGLKISLILIVIMFILSMILYDYEIKFSNFIYYIILSLSSITGAIFGKNKK